MVITRDLALYLAETEPDHIPLPVRYRAKELILDTLGVAVAVVDRRAGIAQFSEEGVHDRGVAAMRTRVNPYGHPALKDVSDPHGIPASFVTIRLTDGRSFWRHRQRPKAYPGGEPATRDDLLEKFNSCVGLVLSSRRARRCRDLVESLEEVPTVSRIAAAVAKP